MGSSPEHRAVKSSSQRTTGTRSASSPPRGRALGHCDEGPLSAGGAHLRLTRLRFGELAALRLDDLDLLRGTLRVDEQLSRQGSSRMTTPGPSSRRRRIARSGCRSGRGARCASDGVSVIDGLRLLPRVGPTTRLRALSTSSLGGFFSWALTDSNRRPLPCKVSAGSFGISPLAGGVVCFPR
jgi:hypothetical protein